MGRVEGKVAFITGAARGQGESHAIRLAEEGADIIALDLCAGVDSVEYEMPGSEDLAQTARSVEALGRRCVVHEGDVRDFDALRAAVDAGVAELGRLDIVCANAGIASYGPALDISERAWQDMIDINLTGAWNTCRAAVPQLADGGSIVITGSTAGLMGVANAAHYTSAKHGLVGLARVLAIELGERRIRVNSVHPTVVNTEMVHNLTTYKLFRPELENPTEKDFQEVTSSINLFGIPWVEPIDVSNVVLFLASDEARYISGVALPVDAGQVQAP